MQDQQAPQTSMNIQRPLDISGGILSFLCLVHCLVLPSLVAAAPSLGLQFFQAEWIHKALLFAVLPVVVLALGRGYKEHNWTVPFWVGGVGSVLLIVGAFWGHDLHLESQLTLAGGVSLIVAHSLNFWASRQACEACCPPEGVSA